MKCCVVTVIIEYNGPFLFFLSGSRRSTLYIMIWYDHVLLCWLVEWGITQSTQINFFVFLLVHIFVLTDPHWSSIKTQKHRKMELRIETSKLDKRSGSSVYACYLTSLTSLHHSHFSFLSFSIIFTLPFSLSL